MGLRGYLATVTSASENAFIQSQFGANFAGSFSTSPTWFGAFQPAGSVEPAGGFGWLTGEAFAYTNWGPGEPNNNLVAGNENVVEIRNDGLWNDTSETRIGQGYLVEFGGFSTAGSFPLTTGASNKLDLGFFSAGAAVTLGLTGQGDLVSSQLQVRPNGELAALASGVYTFCNPGSAYPNFNGGDGINHFPGGGANYDASGSGYPFAGKLTTNTLDSAAIRLGAVVGTFSATPGRADWFFIGYEKTITIPDGGAHLYLAVNDTVPGDNHGAYGYTVTTAPPAPPHGGLSQTQFTVNDSTSPTANVADTVLHFAAAQSGRPAGLFCRVQRTLTPTVESSWTDLSDGNSGRMTYNSALGRFVLNSANYPAQNGVSFRVIGAAQGYPDSISAPVGPFNLSSTVVHLASPKLSFLRNTTVADMYFHARMSTLAPGTAVRVQASTTPGDEASWTDLANGNAGNMTQSTDPNVFLLLVNQYPAASRVYFRAIAAAPGAIDGISTILGPYTLTPDRPPTVSIALPPGSGAGTATDPRVVTSGVLSFSATATSQDRNISSLRLLLHGKTLTPPSPRGSSSVTIQYSTSVIGVGDHVIDAVAIDDLGCRARAGTNPLYLRVVPAPGGASGEGPKTATVVGKVFTLLVSGGAWNNPANWRDSNGNTGVPGDQDLAIVGAKTVQLPNDVVAKSVTLNGGRIIGPGTLSILGILTISGGTFENAFLSIFQGAICELTNVSDVQFAGFINNYGTINIRGSSGLRGVTTLGGPGKVNFLTPLSIAPNALLNPAAGVRVLAAGNLQLSGGLQGSAALISDRGGSVISNDGGSLISQDGGSLISQDGGGIVSHDSGGLISQDGGGLVASGAGNLVASGAGNQPTGSAVGKGAGDQAESGGVVLDGGEIDLSDVTIAAPLTMNGGVLSGTGKIIGDVTNNGGRVSPGNSAGGAGGITVEGSYTQGSGGTLAIENGGRAPTEFDQLTATRAVMLGGNLEVRNINGYTPDSADTLNPLGYGSVAGGFNSVSGNTQVSVNTTGALVAVAPDALAQISAASRKSHGDTGSFDINLPATGTPGIESRAGGATGDHSLVINFNNTLASAAATVTAGPGSVVGSPTINGTSLIVNLTGVSNAQTVTVTLSNVTDTAAQVLPSTLVQASFLAGDVNGDGTVNSGDATIVRSRSGQPTDALNFRADVNVDGTVNSGDFTLVRARSGTSVP